MEQRGLLSSREGGAARRDRTVLSSTVQLPWSSVRGQYSRNHEKKRSGQKQDSSLQTSKKEEQIEILQTGRVTAELVGFVVFFLYIASVNARVSLLE